MTRLALNIQPNFSDADAFYAALTDLFRDAEESEVERINARLVLLLANHIGELDVLLEAIEIAGKLED